MLEAAKVQGLREVRLIEAAVAQGLRLAREAGREDPALQDAVWELLLEATNTLRCLPNRERGWLTASSRAHWPEYLRSAAEELAGTSVGSRRGAEAVARPAIASAGAIDRLDTILVCCRRRGAPTHGAMSVFSLAWPAA